MDIATNVAQYLFPGFTHQYQVCVTDPVIVKAIQEKRFKDATITTWMSDNSTCIYTDNKDTFQEILAVLGNKVKNPELLFYIVGILIVITALVVLYQKNKQTVKIISNNIAEQNTFVQESAYRYWLKKCLFLLSGATTSQEMTKENVEDLQKSINEELIPIIPQGIPVNSPNSPNTKEILVVKGTLEPFQNAIQRTIFEKKNQQQLLTQSKDIYVSYVILKKQIILSSTDKTFLTLKYREQLNRKFKSKSEKSKPIIEKSGVDFYQIHPMILYIVEEAEKKGAVDEAKFQPLFSNTEEFKSLKDAIDTDIQNFKVYAKLLGFYAKLYTERLYKNKNTRMNDISSFLYDMEFWRQNLQKIGEKSKVKKCEESFEKINKKLKETKIFSNRRQLALKLVNYVDDCPEKCEKDLDCKNMKQTRASKSKFDVYSEMLGTSNLQNMLLQSIQKNTWNNIKQRDYIMNEIQSRFQADIQKIEKLKSLLEQEEAQTFLKLKKVIPPGFPNFQDFTLQNINNFLENLKTAGKGVWDIERQQASKNEDIKAATLRTMKNVEQFCLNLKDNYVNYLNLIKNIKTFFDLGFVYFSSANKNQNIRSYTLFDRKITVTRLNKTTPEIRIQLDSTQTSILQELHSTFVKYQGLLIHFIQRTVKAEEFLQRFLKTQQSQDEKKLLENAYEFVRKITMAFNKDFSADIMLKEQYNIGYTQKK